jgi:hypothetical protein
MYTLADVVMNILLCMRRIERLSKGVGGRCKDEIRGSGRWMGYLSKR